MRVIGVDPLRQFLVDAGRGRVQALEAAYDPNQHDWFNVYGSEDRQPGEWGHWTGRGMTWNSMCAACHNTRVRKNYDEAADSYHTTMAEITVSCEACHGPANAHVQWQQKFKSPGMHDPTLAHPTRDQIIDTCGSCHSRRGDLTGDFVSGQSYFDHFTLEGVNETDLFYPDGQIHEEDYEFSAFLGSKMHAAGVRCVDCHDVHSGKTLLEGNALCMRCHAGTYPKAPIINLATHTFHKFDSAGSQCVNCHMPQTPYMQRHRRHDHGFTIPDPLLTKRTGTPNACNRCHTDKDAGWALAAADKWYGKKLDRPSRQRALTIAAARDGAAASIAALLSFLNDPSQGFYWRSAFLRLLGRWAGDPAVTPALLRQLQADHPMVRESAASALMPLIDQQPDIAKALERLLDDPSRSVRMSAANALGNRASPDQLASRELLWYLNQQADTAQGQYQLARLAASRHDKPQTHARLERALGWDSRSATLRSAAATLYGEIGDAHAALEEMRQAVRLEPNTAEFHYQLGLAAAEAGEPAEALASMERAVQLDPGRARAWYNLAMMRAVAGKTADALAAFNKAESLDPADADIPFELAKLLSQLNQTADALAAARRALRIRPDYAPAAELIRELSGSP